MCWASIQQLLPVECSDHLSLQRNLVEDILRFRVEARMSKGGWTLLPASEMLMPKLLQR